MKNIFSKKDRKSILKNQIVFVNKITFTQFVFVVLIGLSIIAINYFNK